jgi:metal-responsive CopG/Arc/MetJ family transcriptional regulator
METVTIDLDTDLLKAADQVARRSKKSRSALMSTALRAHLRNLEIREKDEREREAYLRQPMTEEDAELDAVAAWPEN